MANSTKGKIITFSSFKGGTGKTFTLINVASILSQQDKKILLLDLNFESGDLSLVLNTKSNLTIFNVIDDMSNNRFKDYKNYVEVIDSNIDIVNSLKDPRQGVNIDSHYIDSFLHQVIFKYDYVLVDVGYGFSNSSITGIDVADINYIIVNNDILTIKSTLTALSIFRDAKLDNYKIIVNDSINLNKGILTLFDVENLLKEKVSFYIPKSYYVKNIDKYILNGKVFELCRKVDRKENTYRNIVNSIINDGGK